MKKTLASVLAAAMAMSVSAVAFAKDYQPGENGIGDSTGVSDSMISRSQLIGTEIYYEVSVPEFAFGYEDENSGSKFTSEQLADLRENGLVTFNVYVSDGKSNLETQPTVKVRNVDDTQKAVLSVRFKDTWSTKDVSAQMRISITARKDVYYNDTTSQYTDVKEGNKIVMKKGDTLSMNAFRITAGYKDIASYGNDITISIPEVAEKQVIARGEELFSNSDDSDTVRFNFGGALSYEVKIGSTQSDVNLAYSLDEVQSVTNTYPDVDFQFITFRAQNSGANRFNNNGTLTFNAINGADTEVYEMDGNKLTRLNGKYDSIDETITVTGVKYLTSYVVASEELAVDDMEEDSSNSNNGNNGTNQPSNPGTGAF